MDCGSGGPQQRDGLCDKRPGPRIASPNPHYDAKVEHLEELRVQAQRGEIILLFADEVDFYLLPGIIGCSE